MIALALVLAASDCASCHATQHRQWQQSRHASSATNSLFLASFEKHRKRAWCLTCHAPLKVDTEGVGCTACHSSEHGKDPAVADSARCAKCHDFDVPKSFGVGEGPMQDTYDEWHASKAAAAGRGCSACHDHRARGGHDVELIREALRIEVRRSGGQVTATVSARETGHAVPTGDPFRRLVLSVGEQRRRFVVPADGQVELQLGESAASTWQVTYFHAEVEVREHEHALKVAEGPVVDAQPLRAASRQ